MSKIANIYQLGVKELWSLARDPMMIFLIIFSFTASIYSSSTAAPDGLHRAPIAIIDEDQSPLSHRISSSFYPPRFLTPQAVTLDQVDKGMDNGKYTFALNIPPNFQRNVLANIPTSIQLNVDATRMSQAFTGSGYIQQMVSNEVTEFIERHRNITPPPVDLALRMRFNPNLTQSWFGAIIELINNVTMISIILTGAALIREREHGTIEHLLVMPITPIEIMLAKVWAMGLVVLVASGLSLTFIVQGALHVPIDGSITLFLFGVVVHLFATTSMGIFLATLARSMPQFALLLFLVLLPLQMLSGGTTPRESMPELVQHIMLIAPTTHFIELGQAILYRGAGFMITWKSFLWLFIIGCVFFFISLSRFRKTISRMA